MYNSMAHQHRSVLYHGVSWSKPNNIIINQKLKIPAHTKISCWSFDFICFIVLYPCPGWHPGEKHCCACGTLSFLSRRFICSSWFDNRLCSVINGLKYISRMWQNSDVSWQTSVMKFEETRNQPDLMPLCINSTPFRHLLTSHFYK